jgi:hypothetical protein
MVLEKRIIQKNFGTKNVQKIDLFRKYLKKIQKPEKSELYKRHQTSIVPLCPEKK